MVSETSASAAARPHPIRMFGRFELHQLLGRSQRTMVWLANDPRAGSELLITLPRVAPADVAALEQWLSEARQGARLNHPHLAPVVDVGVHEHWPYIACRRSIGVTLAERLATTKLPAHNESVGWLCHALEGLAFAHDAGVAHHDLQLHSLLIDEQGHVRVMALAAGATPPPQSAAGAGNAMSRARGIAMDPSRLREQRDAAERDLLAIGVLLHRLIGGSSPLDEPDVSRVIELLAPRGREFLRLAWSTPQPVADALRAIANRATDRQLQHRYHNARTMLRALGGWREADAQDSGGPLALLLDRLRTVGHLPTMPGVGTLVLRLARMEREHVDEMAEQILLDMALSFELLRQVNSAQVQGTQVSGNGPVLTVRRAIAMLGLDGVRRAASGLRAWPGPLSESGAAAMQRLMHRVRLAGHIAQLLRPRGYDPEVIFLLAVLQNIGRLMVQYHFPDDAEQIWQLMRPVPASGDAGEQAGMSEEAAAFAVLGTGIDGMTSAVARHFGLTDEVLHMIRRLPLDKPVRTPDSDGDLLRAAASVANEVVDAVWQLSAAKLPQAIDALAKRYNRALGINARDVNDALQIARQALAGGSAADAGADDAKPSDAAGAPA